MDERIKHLKSIVYPPEIIGNPVGKTTFNPFLSYRYKYNKKKRVPLPLAIEITFTGKDSGDGFSFTIKVQSFFQVKKWLSSDDIHKAHLIAISDLQKKINNTLMDIRLRGLNDILYCSDGQNLFQNFVLGFTGN